MTVNIYTLDNRSFEADVLKVHRSIEKKSGLEVRTGQSTIWEYEGTPAQNLLIEGDVTLKELKKLFPEGTALDNYGWIIHIESEYIRLIPITLCQDGTARRENGTTISKEDMAHIKMAKEEEHLEVIYERIMAILLRRPARSSTPSLTSSANGKPKAA